MVPVSELGIGFLLNRYNWQSLQFQRLDDIRPRIATNGPQQPNWRSQYASLVHAARYARHARSDWLTRGQNSGLLR